MIDKTISHYKILSQIGRGGMGVLYLAEDLELNRRAVLKFLPPEMMDDPDINLRFKREAQSAGSLSHPNIVTIYDVGVHENKTFIAMEYVEGKTLRELMKSDELTSESITNISVQICEGLNEAHSKGITHRDIKPENIIIDENGKVKIVDFGLAKVKNISKGITKQDSTVGTIKYMSPEQIRNQNVDHRSDIWSFGVILYEMITGRYPFKGEHDASLFYSIINQSPEPLARYKAEINEGFQRIIDKSLDKDPEIRYQHIDELLSDLRREKRDSGEFAVGNLKRGNKKLIKKISVISASIIAIALIFIAVNYFLDHQTKKIKPPKHTQLTFDGNIYFYENGPLFDRSQISPDGQFTAYVADNGNGNSIYVKDNSGEQAIEIFKGLEYVTSLRWSPDGNEIFFSAIFNNFSYSSYIIPKLGGKDRKLKFAQYGCWSPDGNLVAGINSTNRIIRFIKRETDEVEKTIELTGDIPWLYDIDWSPVGDKIVFLTSDDVYKFSLWTINTDGTHQQKILEESKIIFSPRWSIDGKHVYYLQSNEMTQDLMKLEVSSITDVKVPDVIQTGLLAYGFSITRDNKKLCYTKDNSFSNLWNFMYDEKKNLFKPQKLTPGTDYYGSPAISPGGNKITFVHKDNIFRMSLNGDSIKQLTFLSSVCYCPTWNPDGKEIAFFSESKLYTVPSEGGTPSILRDNDVGGGVNWGSNSEIFYNNQGNRNFYIFNPATRENKLLVSNDSVGWMFNPRLSPDYSQIVVMWNRYLNNQPMRGLWVISRKDSSQKLLLKGSVYPLKWANDGKSIYAINSGKNTQEILIINANTGEGKIIFTFPSDKIDPYEGVDISSDGKTIVCSIQETNSDVWMIENFDPDVE